MPKTSSPLTFTKACALIGFATDGFPIRRLKDDFSRHEGGPPAVGVCDAIPQRYCGRFSRPSLRLWNKDKEQNEGGDLSHARKRLQARSASIEWLGLPECSLSRIRGPSRQADTSGLAKSMKSIDCRPHAGTRTGEV
jgi:hypothetical protein